MKKFKIILTLCISVIVVLTIVNSVLTGIILNQKSEIPATFTPEQNADNKEQNKSQIELLSVDTDYTNKNLNKYPLDVSMIQLISNPEKYDGKFVRVKGVGNIEFEGNYISLSKEDWKYHTGNSIWIEFGPALSLNNPEEYNGEYVIVEGIFDKDNNGHLDMFHGSIKNINRYDPSNANLFSHLTVTQELDNTYSYKVTDYKDRVLALEENLTKLPKQQYLQHDIVGICIQAGTGLSTNYATYYDLENSLISETFYYVLTAEDRYVVYADRRNDEHFIIVRDIFDKEQYYKEYKLENVSPVAADFAICGDFDSDGNIIITYLSRDDYKKTEYTIELYPVIQTQTAE